MGMLSKLLMLFFCINTFMYLGTSYMLNEGGAASPTAVRFQGDLFDLLLQDKGVLNSDLDSYANALAAGENITISRGYNLSSDFANAPALQEEKITLGTVISFGIDTVKIVFAFVLTLFNFVIAPITVFSYSKLPPFLVIMFGLPFVLVFVLSIYAFLRSGQT